jgi:hypothetical protein
VKLDPADVRAYMDRPWAAQAQQKIEYWRARKARFGLAEVFRVDELLRRQAQLIDPTWPHEKDREKDFETHQRVSEALRKVGVEPRRRARVRRVR